MLIVLYCFVLHFEGIESIIYLKIRCTKGWLPILLKDKTTKKNIIWATSSYEQFGDQYADDKQITTEALTGLNPILLQPRIMKTMEQQQARTKVHAEVFTPAWICNKMNNYCDEEWFYRKNVFNILQDKQWDITQEKILFPPNKTWRQYIDSRRLEITCGEAPYIASRYDTSTGEAIPIRDRIGILDRKLRIINEIQTMKKNGLNGQSGLFRAYMDMNIKVIIF